jgi:hypothetical protein
MRSMDWELACFAVSSSAESVADVVVRVYDWDTARRSFCDILKAQWDSMLRLRGNEEQ